MEVAKGVGICKSMACSQTTNAASVSESVSFSFYVVSYRPRPSFSQCQFVSFIVVAVSLEEETTN
jgi:hypothetical protein